MTIMMRASESPFWREDLEECASCRDRGACCYFSALVHVRGVELNIKSSYPCPHLKQGLCGRYETRHEVPWCGAVGDPNVGWPDFCIHCRGPADRVIDEENLEAMGILPKEIDVIISQVNDIIRKQMDKEGYFWGSRQGWIKRDK